MEILLVGNKNDLEEARRVTVGEGNKLDAQNALTFVKFI